MICDSGGKICLSDDSHGVSQVGLNYDRLRDYLARTGVEEIYYLVDFKDRKPGDEDVGCRGRVVARMVSDWDDNPFWKNLLEKRRIGK
jgi:histidinol-phosphatase (PHP family)